MPLGIRPTNDMAFKKTFGTEENKLCLISLLNAILELDSPIVDVQIENPYQLQDFETDKLSILEIWFFWLLHAHEYEPEELLKLLPQAALQQATRAIQKIAEKTEDKVMYDAREKAIRDYQTAINSALREGRLAGMLEGKLEGKLEGEKIGDLMGTIRTLQQILMVPQTDKETLRGMSTEELEALAMELQQSVRSRLSS
jgi:hypothetical protein